ncbi:hypothetical protein [Chachezhania sediminis]|nr:hypothetical protein [Chachezhania sediminis]
MMKRFVLTLALAGVLAGCGADGEPERPVDSTPPPADLTDGLGAM